jgi:carboxyl-terminal processing protease
VTEAIGVASIFLPEDAVVMTTRGLHEPTEVRRARGNPIPESVPLVVLVDGSSASASEIVAGALRDDGRARLVGTTTFGKALVQGTYALPGGGAVKLTTATYLTPDGHDIGHRGLTPGVRAVDDPATPRDEALTRALALVLQEASRG